MNNYTVRLSGLRPQIEDAAAQEFLAPSELVRQILRKAPLFERQIERSKKQQQQQK